MAGEALAYTGRLSKRTFLACIALAMLCLLAYVPSLFLPLLEDDYANIWMAEHYGPVAGAPLMFHDGIARVRATVYWTLYLVWKFFRFTPMAYRISSLALHVVNTWLLFGIGLAWVRMRGGAFWAAAFFAVHEGHQEAIMWLSGNSEVLQFAFGGAALLCWMKAASGSGQAWKWRSAGLAAFVLALLSKESAFILVPLFLLVEPPFGRSKADLRKYALHLLPYCLLAGVAVVSVAITRSHSFRFSDGSFSLHAPVWLTLPRNFGRVLWIWGVVSAAGIFFTKTTAEVRKSAWIAMAWIAIGLFPYSFLTYSPQIPSRQLYLASAGLAFLFGLAAEQAIRAAKNREWMVAAVMLVVLAHNVGYIWIKKQRQFRERAEATEELIQVARQTEGTIWVQCFPQPDSIAEAAMYVALDRIPSRLVFSAEDAARTSPAAVFCFRRISPRR